jgi:hypothetical protein
MSQTQSKSRISRLVSIGRHVLNKQNVSNKEVKRFTEIYTIVYRHARKKGQAHKAALRYCWNVYAKQAPEAEKRIIKNIMSHKMKLNKQDLRQMIIREMVEADVINMSDFKHKAIDPDPEVAPAAVFDAFISEMHNQITSFMEESAEDLDSDQQLFLDELLDNIEDRLGIGEEDGFDTSSYEDEEDV